MPKTFQVDSVLVAFRRGATESLSRHLTVHAMGIKSNIDKDRRLVTTRATGHVEGVEVIEHQRKLAADPDFDPGFSHLFDLTDVEAFDVSASQISAVASVSIFHRDSRRAILAPRNALFGLSRMYEGFRQPPDETVQVFRSAEEALAWLGE